MRQRKLRNLDAKYEAYSDIIVDAPAEMRGRWAELSGVAPLFIEIGCGKANSYPNSQRGNRIAFLLR